MTKTRDNSAGYPEDIAATAATWVMRLDRGLSPAEQDEYLHWLAADKRHAESMARLQRTWEAFDRLAGLQSSVEAVPDPDLLVEKRRPFVPRIAWLAIPLAAAAALAILWWPRQTSFSWFSARPITAEVVQLSPIEKRALADGSTIQLNRDAKVAVDYSSAERLIRLNRGEAAFEVTKDPTRPFVVAVAGVTVRAVGTTFNVRYGEEAVDVIVTEGQVALRRQDEPDSTAPATFVSAGQRATVPHGSAAQAPLVSTPPAEEIARRLAWQPRLLTFTDEPLTVILTEFNRHNPVVLRLDDPTLKDLRLSARFYSDNVQGFLRLLESEFRVQAQRTNAGEIVLHAAP